MAVLTAPASIPVDVVLKDGILYGSDEVSGIHILGYGCNTVGDATLTSTG